MGRTRASVFSVRSGAGGIALAASLLASTAAATPTARLTLARGSGAEHCPDEEFLRRVVAARLGYDPFFAWAKKTVIVEVARTAKGFRGRAQIVDDKGVVLGERVLDAKGDDCREPMTALGLAISIALDDLESSASPSPPPTPVPPAAPIPPPSPPNESPPAVSQPALLPVAPVHVLVAAGPVSTIGVAPGPTSGGDVSVGVSGERWAIRAEVFLEGRAAAKVLQEVSVAGQPWGTSLLACARIALPFVCAAVSLTAFESEAEGSVVSPHTGRAPLLGFGARIGAEFPEAGWYFLRGETGADIHTLRPHVTVDGRDLYEASLAAAYLGISAGVRLF